LKIEYKASLSLLSLIALPNASLCL